MVTDSQKKKLFLLMHPLLDAAAVSLGGAPLDGNVEAKAQMKQLKKDLKDFEHQFFSAEGRKPGKNDIVSNKEIARKYKLYAKLKSQLEVSSSSKELETDEVQPLNASLNLPNSIDSSAGAVEVGSLVSAKSVPRSEAAPLGNGAVSRARTVSSTSPKSPAGTKGFDFLEDLPENFKLNKNSKIDELKTPTRSATLSEPNKTESSSFATESPLKENSPSVVEFLSRKKELEALSTNVEVQESNFGADQNAPVDSVEPTKQTTEAAPQAMEAPVVADNPSIQVESDSESEDSETEENSDNREDRQEVNEQPRKEPVDEPENSSKNMVSPAPVSPQTPKASASEDVKVGDSPTNASSSDALAVPSKGSSHFALAERRSPTPPPGAAALAAAASVFDKEKAKRAVDKLATSGAALKVASEMITDPKLFQRLPRKGILRCRVYRKTSLFDMSHPTFFMYNEADEKFLMAARKRVKSKNINYIISSSHDELTKNSTHYVAKLKANPSRTQFVLFDARAYNDHAPAKGLRELAAVSYSKTVLPREMQAVIPAISIVEDSDQVSKDVLEDMRIRNMGKLLFLRNKPPRWNEATQTHCLNFGGRVTMPSIKNFQLINEAEESTILMQFGRTGPDLFTLDVRYPLTPIEAFAFALSTFDAYDSS